jgi:hypothetical protein
MRTVVTIPHNGTKLQNHAQRPTKTKAGAVAESAIIAVIYRGHRFAIIIRP